MFYFIINFYLFFLYILKFIYLMTMVTHFCLLMAILSPHISHEPTHTAVDVKPISCSVTVLQDFNSLNIDYKWILH